MDLEKIPRWRNRTMRPLPATVSRVPNRPTKLTTGRSQGRSTATTRKQKGSRDQQYAERDDPKRFTQSVRIDSRTELAEDSGVLSNCSQLDRSDRSAETGGLFRPRRPGRSRSSLGRSSDPKSLCHQTLQPLWFLAQPRWVLGGAVEDGADLEWLKLTVRSCFLRSCE
jgi:hypothetical protein